MLVPPAARSRSRVLIPTLAAHAPQGTKMPSIAYYRNYVKTFKKPRRPFEKERLDAELKVRALQGLRLVAGLHPHGGGSVRLGARRCCSC